MRDFLPSRNTFMRDFLPSHHTFMRNFLPNYYTFMRDFCVEPPLIVRLIIEKVYFCNGNS